MLRVKMFKSSLLICVYLSVLATFCKADNEQVSPNDRFRLHSGDLMPYVGFGTFRIKGDAPVKEVLDHVLAAGYRLIDTAQVYENEESIGKALKVLLPKHNLTRKDIFITTKLDSNYLGSDSVYNRIENSIKNLGSEYLDLLLIHSAGLRSRGSKSNPKNDSVLRDETWQVFITAVKQGLVRNIGVSNYNVRHLNELLRNDHGVKPAVNQVEWHPNNHQADLLDLCRKEGILLQAYFSLGGTGKQEVLLKRPEVVKIAEKLKRTPSQILLRWALQQKIAIIPKSLSEAHIRDNLNLDFTIPAEDMKTLSSFEQNRLGFSPDRYQ